MCPLTYSFLAGIVHLRLDELMLSYANLFRLSGDLFIDRFFLGTLFRLVFIELLGKGEGKEDWRACSEQKNGLLIKNAYLEFLFQFR